MVRGLKVRDKRQVDKIDFFKVLAICMQIEKNVETSRDTHSDKIETHGRFTETRKKWEKSRNELKKKEKNELDKL